MPSLKIQPQIIAHRGNSAFFPENTLEAFQDALTKSGASGIEFDIQSSQDDAPIIIHDNTLERTTDGHGHTRDYTLNELRMLDAGYSFKTPKSKGYPYRKQGLRIPSLEDLLKRFPKHFLIVEIKDKFPSLIMKTVKLLEEYRVSSSYIIGSFNAEAAHTLEKKFSHLHRFYSFRDLLGIYTRFKLGKPLPKLLGPRTASMPLRYRGLSFENTKWLDYLRRQNIDIIFWTINDPVKANELFRKGASGIITDDPHRMKCSLGQDS